MSTAVAAPADRLVTLPEADPELTLGWQVAQWMMSTLRQPNGARAGRPFRLVPSQIRFLLWWYALDPDGGWLFQHGVRRLSKGSGKSPFAAALALAELCGPVRLAGFDPAVPGGCVGRPVAMPLVQIAATAESQTDNTMRMVRALAPKGSKIATKYHLEPGKQQYNMSPEGMLRVITSSSSSAEGAEASFVVADEVEWWLPSNGGPDLHATLMDNVTKSGSRMVETSNAWVPGVGSVAEDTWDSWVAQEEGRYREGAARILYDARVAPPDTDMADAVSLRSALEFVYDDCWWQNIEPIVGRIWSPKARPDDSKRKYLNQPTAAADAWVSPQEWSVLADPTVVVADGDEVVLFFDGSKSRDATALVGCRMSDGHVFTVGVWEPDPRHDAVSTVDPAEVDREVRLALDRWDVVAFFADVKEWESFALTEWPNRYSDDLLVWAAPSAKPPAAVAWDMRSHKDEFAKAAEACHAEITGREFTHDGDSRTARHVGNARRRPYRDMVSIGKESPDSPKKVDAAVCVVGARMVRRLVLGSKQWQKRQRRATGRGRVIVLS
ncbi:MAG: terminase [Actinobacteria bacterium]|nr:terminase [Actinomycetota bacterium]